MNLQHGTTVIPARHNQSHMPAKQVLIVEDERPIREMIAFATHQKVFAALRLFDQLGAVFYTLHHRIQLSHELIGHKRCTAFFCSESDPSPIEPPNAQRSKRSSLQVRRDVSEHPARSGPLEDTRCVELLP